MAINHGARPLKIDHRDFDFHKSFGSTGIPVFPAQYFCDAALTMPDQNADGQPYGCTNYASADITTDQTESVHMPQDLEAVTHANAKGGYDIRDSLNAARGIAWFAAFFNIRAYAPLDYFDAFRYAQIAGVPEKRSITWGTPWFPSWEKACDSAINPSGIMPMPTTQELANAKNIGWHDSKLDGWTTANGVTLYRDKSWQGRNVGKGGFIFFPREVINMVMSIQGTCGFTVTQSKPPAIQTIDIGIWDWLMSHWRQFLALQY